MSEGVRVLECKCVRVCGQVAVCVCGQVGGCMSACVGVCHSIKVCLLLSMNSFERREHGSKVGKYQKGLESAVTTFLRL